MTGYKVSHRAVYITLAALVLCSLCACGGAPARDTAGPAGAADGIQEPATPAEGMEALSSKSSQAEKINHYISLINDELDTMRKLGLFQLEFEAVKSGKADVDGDNVRIQHHPPDGPRSDDDPCSYYVIFDRTVGQITFLRVVCRPQEDWESVTSDDRLEIYDRLDAVIDPEMTLGDYCDAWAQYRGYERWELPEGVDSDTLYMDAPSLEQWAEGIYDSLFDLSYPGLTVSFYRAGETEPVSGYIQYQGTTGGPELGFGESFTRG